MKNSQLSQSVEVLVSKIMDSVMGKKEVKDNIIEANNNGVEVKMDSDRSHQELLTKIQKNYKESENKIDAYKKSIAEFAEKNKKKNKIKFIL